MDSAPSAAVSSSPSRKKQKIDGDSALAPPSSEASDDGQQQDYSASFHELIQWAENNFEPESSRVIFASSPDLTAREILNFILKYVYIHHPDDDNFDSDDDNEYVIDEEDENRVKSSRAALKFVTCWLGKERDELKMCRIPSLSQLCAQHLAADLFSGLADTVTYNVIYCIGNYNDGMWDECLNVLHACILSKIDNHKSQTTPSLTHVPESFQDDVMEELYIFIIVYVLYADLRWIEQDPTSKSNVTIPIRKHDIRQNRYGVGTGWWVYFGYDLACSVVPNSGRGALAKAGLLPHAILTHYLNNYSDLWNAGYDSHSLIMDHLIQDGKSLVVIHPFACSIAVPSIAAFMHVYHDHAECYHECDIDEIHQFLLQTYKYLNGGLSPPTDEYDKLLCVSGKKTSIEKGEDIQKHPLKVMGLDALKKLVGNYLDKHEASKIEDELYVRGHKTSKTYVQRLRLRGDHDKAYLLKAAITSKEAHFLDLQHCSSLDEECLVAMLHHMENVKHVLLHGTSIPENSKFIQEMSKTRKIHFGFKSGVCRCCGRVPFLNKDQIDPPPHELMEEIRKLKEENAKLRKRLAEPS